MELLARMTFPEVASLAADLRAVVLFPIGTTEAHGPHLPLDTDCLSAEEIAGQTALHLEAAGYRTVLAPTVPFGTATVTMPYAGTISIQPGTLELLLSDALRSLSAHGFRRVVLVNHHGQKDHILAIGRAAEAADRELPLRVDVVGLTPEYHRPGAQMSLGWEGLMRGAHPELDWHAGEYETALVMWRRPDTVDAELIRSLPDVHVDLHAAWERGARTFRDLPDSERCYFGAPAAATAETGRQMYELRGRLIAAALLARWAAEGDPGR